jgi:ankyrin repeat protein
MRAVIANDTEVARVLLEKGASPNVVAMGLTPFLVASGVGTGGRGTGLAASTTAGGTANTAIMDLLVAHGADVNARVAGTKTYSMRISRAPSNNEGMSALHVAAQTGRIEVVRYLLEKGANPELTDNNGRKPIDLVSTGARPPAPAPAVGSAAGAASAPAAATPPAGGRGGPGANQASAAEIRVLLQSAPARK